MPSIAVRTFTDPVEYFAGIRNLQIDGFVVGRGEFCAKSTRIDLHRLWMHRFDEDLPRIMKVTPSGTRAGILFALRRAQPAMQVNGIETSQNQIAKFGLNRDWYHRSLASCEWGTMSLTREDFAAVGEAMFGHELVSFFHRQRGTSGDRSVAAAQSARSSRPPSENRPGHSREARGSAGDRTGFGGSDDVLPSRQSLRGYAQCPAPSRENNAASGSDAGGEL